MTSSSVINAIEVDHVTMFYGQQIAIDHVSFAIPEGRYVGVIGPNGGGKTTMLKIILGLLRPTEGSVSIFGQSPIQARKSGLIGYVPQRVSQADFPFPATALEIVESGRASRIGIGRRMKTADRAIIENSMKMAGVWHLRERIIGTLSGGERQKVFIARALAAEPKLLILDEPTTGVDAASREQFYALLKKLHADLGLTILFVSHDVEVMTHEVAFVLALNQKILCHCSSHDFLSDETLHRLYGKELELQHPHHH